MKTQVKEFGRFADMAYVKFYLVLIYSLGVLSFDNSCFSLFKYKEYKFPYSYSNIIKYKPKSSIKLRSVNEIQDFKIGTYNLENFSGQSITLNKSEIRTKTRKIMQSISESNLDVLVMQEVLDPQYLKKVVKEYLNDSYKVLYIENAGVSDNIAFIVKKDLPFTFDLHSLKDYKFGDRVAFNKDFPILEIKLNERPIMFYGGLHLKSKFGGSARNNFYGQVRENQVKSILNIKQKIEKNYSDAPFVIGGDFNSNFLDNPSEFNLLKKFMTDSFDLSAKKAPSRLTNITNYKKKRITGQLDGIFVSNNSLSKVSVKDTRVYQYTNNKGYLIKLEDPRSTRDMMPSDHSMVISTFDFQSLIKR